MKYRRVSSAVLVCATVAGAPLPAAAKDSGEGLAAIVRVIARILGGEDDAGAGGAAAAAVAASDPRPCGMLAGKIDGDMQSLTRLEREITSERGKLSALETRYGTPDADKAPASLLDARSRQSNRIGWFTKDFEAHRADIASFNARCTTGADAMRMREGFILRSEIKG